MRIHGLRFCFLRLPPPSSSTLFPYTTLFRSQILCSHHRVRLAILHGLTSSPTHHRDPLVAVPRIRRRHLDNRAANVRSEEHTSELQSHHDLVCRLLLEKKKKKHQIPSHDTHT